MRRERTDLYFDEALDNVKIVRGQEVAEPAVVPLLADADARTIREHAMKSGEVCPKCAFHLAYRAYDGSRRCMACNALWPEKEKT